MTNLLFDYAKEYLNRGLKVLPLSYPIKTHNQFLCSCGDQNCTKNMGKHPAAELVPNSLKDATADIDVIEGWFRTRPWNIAIVTGQTSGIFALDIDHRHRGDQSLLELEKQNGPLPETWRFRTGGGGEHVLFRHPGGLIPNSVQKIAPGIDVRGDGGYIVAPPSKHFSGSFYLIAANCHEDISDPPDWLMARVLLNPLEVENSARQNAVSNSGRAESSEVEESRIRSALKFIPADDRDVWLRVGMALHRTGWGFPARTIWDDWSRASSKFDPRDQDKTWRSFRCGSYNGRSVTLGTIFHLAKANGWRNGFSANLINHAARILSSCGLDPHDWLDLVIEFNAQQGNSDILDIDMAKLVAFAVEELERRARRHGVEVRRV